MAVAIQNIDRSTLSIAAKHAFDILINLPISKFNQLKTLMNLTEPGVLGPTTLEAFLQLCIERGLDLSKAGLSAFKHQHFLDDTGSNEGVIGPTTAAVYFDEIIAKRVFCPFAKKDASQANNAGAFVDGPPRGVLHTTEGPTFASARSAFVAENTWPHFTVTFENGVFEAFQHLPINVAARTLANDPSGVQTNRQNAIQIEIVGGAANSPNFPKAYLDGIARLMRWIEFNAGVKRQASVLFEPPFINSVRLSNSAWNAYEGWLGHQHVPENSHTDPGKIDISYLLTGNT